MSKNCRQCGYILNDSEFPKNRMICKSCQAERYKAWSEKNKERRGEYFREYVKQNKDRRNEYNRGYYEKNISKIRADRREKYRENPDIEKATALRWRENNRQNVRERMQMWRVKNAEYIKNYASENAHLHAEKAARRRTAAKMATPAWANLDIAKEILRKRYTRRHVD